MLVVTKPDRSARSTAELLAIEADLTRRSIRLVVLSMGGTKQAGHPQSDQQAHVDDPRRCGDLETRNDA
jgi:DNA invertase Pin-like site-specific DNA recombinase